ncbi:MAG: mannose-1-phosphate guanylyltransferase [Anaerolineae bacterium]|nr:mannose-1-phosphate guanylyltransferase [Anaerolineae bacterium]
MIEHLYALIMAGGGGTRLWPLSRQNHPKQTLSLVGNRTLFQAAVDRLLPSLRLERIFVVTAADQVEALAAQYPHLPRENFIVEPLGRGTASCIGLGSLHIRNLDPDAVVAVVTADHHIEDVDAFGQGLSAATTVAQQGYLVTLGITPAYPATGYGYIAMGDKLDVDSALSVYQAAAFTEKPDRERAQQFLEAGTYAWNSGMFIWRADRILEEIGIWMPELSQVLRDLDSVWGTIEYKSRIAELWPTLQKETIDYGIMERAERVAAIPVEIGWSDIGTWSSVMGIYDTDDAGNALLGDVLAIETEKTMVVSQGERFVVTIGLDDLIVVDTPDAVLITRRDMSQRVRDVVNWLRANKRDELL